MDHDCNKDGRCTPDYCYEEHRAMSATWGGAMRWTPSDDPYVRPL